MGQQFGIIPTGKALGADIIDFDIHKMDEDDATRIRSAWLEHLVLRFRGLDFGDAEQVRFTKFLGDPELSPRALCTGEELVENHPEIGVISNVLDEKTGEPIGTLGDGECMWHTDMSYIEKPPTASMLHALELPPAGTGGDTEFLCMYTALETLDPAIVERIEGKLLRHENVTLSSGGVRKGMEDKIPTSGDVRDWQGPSHPIIRVHPETGRRCLFLGRRIHAYIESMEVEESEEILDAIWAHIMQPEFCWQQVWKLGDMVLWDNRCVMHRRDAFDPATRRIMHRTQLKGDLVT
ncbi:MAG TPA: taurine catabolism dioxygenase TauD [Rhodospirillaceae bacterium]|nr:taurine catabolism dioxygenase TauD [Rhodospirillaceae bacterium]MBL25053.1 taurine catabolism dioxygenase TauD [Rhodospirillaceae bacterium]HAT35142.1 taurine catabolism dioxygenase TauD [Rhodospirillaceae bacterium]